MSGKGTSQLLSTVLPGRALGITGLLGNEARQTSGWVKDIFGIRRAEKVRKQEKWAHPLGCIETVVQGRLNDTGLEKTKSALPSMWLVPGWNQLHPRFLPPSFPLFQFSLSLVCETSIFALDFSFPDCET